MKRLLFTSVLATLLLTTACGGDDKKAWWLLLGLLGDGGSAVAATSAGDEPTAPGADSDPAALAAPEVANRDAPRAEDESFTLNSDRPVPVAVTVSDNSGPVSGAIVAVQDGQGETLFQGITGDDGRIDAVVNAPADEQSLTLSITVGEETQTIVVENLDELAAIDRELTFSGDVSTPALADADGDGMPDELDFYPADATRAARIVYEPVIISYEDLYPSKGDADLNDYTIRAVYEEDLNAAGDIAAVRASFQHVARGAGYRHRLYVKLPGAASLTRSFDGGAASVSSVAAHTAYEILPDSSTTISQSNTSSSQSYRPGKLATLEVVFNAPLLRSTLGLPPYDLYAYVINTNREVHFPGRVLNGSGADAYLDADGFPWAVKLPESWLWPLESKSVGSAYAEFAAWASSNGRDYLDWFLRPDASKVFAR